MGNESKKLLLADDSITIQKVVELVLADEGFELKLTGNGEDALEALSSFKPDIVLADVEMPKMGGYELCQTIKSSPATNSIPVILMVGAFETVDEDLIKKAGADDYIIKPFESHDLVSKLRNALPAEEEERLAAEGFSEILAQAADETDFTGGLARKGFEVDHPKDELVSEEYVKEVVVSPVEEAARPAPEAKPDMPAISPPAINPEEIKAAIEARVGASVQEALGQLDLARIILEAAAPALSEAARKIAVETLPGIVESLVSQATAAAMAETKKEVERVVWETVPELAESIIKKEIESIKQGI
ncbi:MAG: response regulator [Nitrospiraceae bacterium]|nr:response regulator [Nitrospiraceae bacterium]